MSKRRQGKYWPASLLKQRGWTNALIKELLPQPRVFFHQGRPVRVWSREDVQKGESAPQFLQHQAEWEAAGAPVASAPKPPAEGIFPPAP